MNSDIYRKLAGRSCAGYLPLNVCTAIYLSPYNLISIEIFIFIAFFLGFGHHALAKARDLQRLMFS